VQMLARDFARAEIEPHAAEWDREHRFPRDLFVKLAELGLMGTCVPEEYGGAGTDFVSYILALEELSRADAGVGVTVAVHTSAVTLPLLDFGTEEQQARFVPPLARGEHLGAFALTEPEAGSDAGSLRTRAVQEGDGWRITGAKQWITNGRYAGTFLVFARTDPESLAARGVSAFILDADAHPDIGRPWPRPVRRTLGPLRQDLVRVLRSLRHNFPYACDKRHIHACMEKITHAVHEYQPRLTPSQRDIKRRRMNGNAESGTRGPRVAVFLVLRLSHSLQAGRKSERVAVIASG